MKDGFLTLRIDQNLIDKAKAKAIELGISRSEIIRQALEQYFLANETEE